MVPTTKTRRTLRLILSHFDLRPRLEGSYERVRPPHTVGPEIDPWWIPLGSVADLGAQG